MNSTKPINAGTVLCFGLLLAVLAGCITGTLEGKQGAIGTQNQQSESGMPSGFEWAVEENFKMLVPKEWERNTQGTLFMWASPRESEQDLFQENTIVLLEPLPENKNLQSYFEESVTAIAGELDGFALNNAEEITLGNEPALLAEYTANVDGVPVYYYQVFAVKDNTIYILAFATAEAELNEQQEKISVMKESFTITGGALDVAGENVPNQEPAETETRESDKVSAYPELVRKWRVYSKAIYYDSGGWNFLETPTSTYLELKEDNTWGFGSSTGTWAVEDITEEDWSVWGVGSYGPTRKIVLHGWSNDRGDGPIEGTQTNADFIWVIYRTAPPVVQSPAQVQMKFGWTYGR